MIRGAELSKLNGEDSQAFTVLPCEKNAQVRAIDSVVRLPSSEKVL